MEKVFIPEATVTFNTDEAETDNYYHSPIGYGPRDDMEIREDPITSSGTRDWEQTIHCHPDKTYPAYLYQEPKLNATRIPREDTNNSMEPPPRYSVKPLQTSKLKTEYSRNPPLRDPNLSFIPRRESAPTMLPGAALFPNNTNSIHKEWGDEIDNNRTSIPMSSFFANAQPSTRFNTSNCSESLKDLISKGLAPVNNPPVKALKDIMKAKLPKYESLDTLSRNLKDHLSGLIYFTTMSMEAIYYALSDPAEAIVAIHVDHQIALHYYISRVLGTKLQYLKVGLPQTAGITLLHKVWSACFGHSSTFCYGIDKISLLLSYKWNREKESWMEFLAKFRELIETIQLMLGETFGKKTLSGILLLSIPNYLRKAIIPQLTAKSTESPTIEAINDHVLQLISADNLNNTKEDSYNKGTKGSKQDNKRNFNN